MKIAFITVGDPARLTGGYLYHAQVFARLRARGFDLVEIVASGASQPEQAGRRAAFGQAFDPAAYDVTVVDALARTVCAPHLDGWRAQRPLVAMVHELPSVAAGAAHANADEAPLLRADRVIAVSNHGAAILQARGVPTECISIVSPGRDRIQQITAENAKNAEGDSFMVSAHSASSAVNISPLVLCVAQWIPRKGIETLVEAWSLRRERHARLELVGETDADPAYEAAVRAAISVVGDESLIVRGAIGDAALDAAYRAADVFALPSRYEGYGMVFAEALDYSLPVVACAVGPVPELVGDAGLLVAPGDPAALATALDTLIADPALRQRLAEAARVRAKALPSWDDTAERFARVLHEAARRTGQINQVPD